MAINFELVSDLQTVTRRDFTVATRTQVDPTTANPIIDGEFVWVDTSYKLIRAVSASPAWAVFSERGRYDVQSLGKLTVLHLNPYEADTLIFTSAALALGGKLQVSDAVSYDGQTKSGLANYASGECIGYVTRLPANNGLKLRFLQTLF